MSRNFEEFKKPIIGPTLGKVGDIDEVIEKSKPGYVEKGRSARKNERRISTYEC